MRRLASPHAMFTVRAVASLTAPTFTERAQPHAPSFPKRRFSVPARHSVLVPYLVSVEHRECLPAGCKPCLCSVAQHFALGCRARNVWRAQPYL